MSERRTWTVRYLDDEDVIRTRNVVAATAEAARYIVSEKLGVFTLTAALAIDQDSFSEFD